MVSANNCLQRKGYRPNECSQVPFPQMSNFFDEMSVGEMTFDQNPGAPTFRHDSGENVNRSIDERKSISIGENHSVSNSHATTQKIKLPPSLRPYLPTYRLTNKPTYLPTYLSTYLPNLTTNLTTYQPTHLPTYLPTYRLTDLPTYIPTYLPPSHLPTHLPTYPFT